MKKYTIFFLIAIVGISLFLLGFNYRNTTHPKEVYQVYLNDEVIGVVDSLKKLNNYIDKRGEYIKEKYNVDTIYAPVGLKTQKLLTYDKKVDTVQNIYKKIEEKDDFTIKGYQFVVKNDIKENKIYVLDKSVFDKAVEEVMKIYVGTESYSSFKNGTQNPITETGKIIEKIYLEDNITVKETLIPVNSIIYRDYNELANFLIFGSDNKPQIYKVVAGDTIESVSFSHEISVEEFLISNPKFTNKNNLLFPGQEVVIGVTDPQIKVIVEEHEVFDAVSKFKVEERYDKDKLIGDEDIIQYGEDGIERITQKKKIANGTIVYVEPKGRVELKPTINQIVVKGSKVLPSVGSLTHWGWPTASGYSISDYFRFRINPVTGKRENHQGLDIAGTGYGSPIYAANHGVVSKVGNQPGGYGIYVIINHNNGYYTLYGHMSSYRVKVGQIVQRGERIGSMGSTGMSTGPHLHYEIWVGEPYNGGYRIDPQRMYR